jgi:hypothetical protein
MKAVEIATPSAIPPTISTDRIGFRRRLFQARRRL